MRPVEMNGIVNRTQDFAHLRQQEEHRLVADQSAFSEKINKMIEHTADTVVKKNDPNLDQQKFDAKEKGKNSYYAEKKKKDKKENKEDVSIKKKQTYSSFDIRI